MFLIRALISSKLQSQDESSPNVRPFHDLEQGNGSWQRQRTDPQEPKPASFTTQFLYRLTGLWFVSVAAGSVVLSVPISCVGLPIIIGLGLTSLVFAFIAQTLMKIWLSLIRSGFEAIKSVFYTPFHILGSLTRRVSSLFGLDVDILQPTHLQPPQLPAAGTLCRRFSTSSRLTDRSNDSHHASNSEYQSTKWRYYDQSNQGAPTFFSSLPSPKQTIEFDAANLIPPPLPRLNAAFYHLGPTDVQRLDMCAELYSLSTSIPLDQVDLKVGGISESGAVHHIISMWSEPELNEPLDNSHLIGFCEYFVAPMSPSIFHIDKLNVSSSYSENGFSKRLIRKLMNSPGCKSIQVWSVWHAESFYKGLGFKNVLEYSASDRSIGKRARKVEGVHGPLLVWNNLEQVPLHPSPNPSLRTSDSVGTLRPAESVTSLNSKASNVTLRGGLGSFKNV